MRKIIIALIILAMGTILCGCGASPSDAARSFLDGVKACDADAISEVYEGGEFDMLTVASNSEKNSESSDGEMSNVYDECVLPKMSEFEYEIKSEEVDGDAATIEVSIKTYPMGDAFTNFYSEYLTQAFTLAFSGASDEQMEKVGANIMRNQMDKLTEKTFEKTAKIKLVKKDDKWLVKKLTSKSPIVDAISGGLVTSLENLDSMWGE